jgi:hypothetical protein
VNTPEAKSIHEKRNLALNKEFSYFHQTFRITRLRWFEDGKGIVLCWLLIAAKKGRREHGVAFVCR